MTQQGVTGAETELLQNAWYKIRKRDDKELFEGMVDNTKSILIVDDSEFVRELVSLILKGAGYDVIEAINGRDALDKLDNKKVEMVITDLKMPIMNGIELIKHLRSNDMYKFIPVIILTSEFYEAKRQDFIKAGVDGWILKPFLHQQLLSVISGLI